eukprot:1106773-Lingulodinium_polyedra.AAC.1
MLGEAACRGAARRGAAWHRAAWHEAGAAQLALRVLRARAAITVARAREAGAMRNVYVAAMGR